MESRDHPRGRTDSESEYEIKNPFQNFKFSTYLKEEVRQTFSRREEEDSSQKQCSGPFRNRVYKFLSIPQYFEMFMAYGLLQCLDHILLVYTFLPLRCFATCASFISFMIRSLLGIIISSIKPTNRFKLSSTDARDLVKFSFVCLCTIFLYTFDSSIAYHEIRTQSIIKIYIFFNLLEVADRLLSAVYLDAIDDVLFTVSAGLRSSKNNFCSTKPGCQPDENESSSDTWSSFVLQYIFALLCLSAHCLLLLAQVTTLNVAFNSQNRSLLTVMISNNFVELKSNVFRKMGKSNLFQIACADVRERFHYSIWLFIIVCRNMSATGWQSDDFLTLLPDIMLILISEIAVDWVKHAFISKFNVISPDVYEEYTVSIAYDLLLCRQGKNSADYFELLARRMGLTPISLSCLINVMLIQTVRSSWIFLVFLLAVPFLFLVKVLVHLVLLRLAYAHVHAYTILMSTKLGTLVPTSDEQEVILNHNLQTGKVNDETKQNMFCPYSGYDQPTRDEGQLAMPKPIPHRRSHSDTTRSDVPSQLVEESLSKYSSTKDLSDSVELSQFCNMPSLGTTRRGILKPIIQNALPDDNKEEKSSRYFEVDTFSGESNDMVIRNRKQTSIHSTSIAATPIEMSDYQDKLSSLDGECTPLRKCTNTIRPEGTEICVKKSAFKHKRHHKSPFAFSTPARNGRFPRINRCWSSDDISSYYTDQVSYILTESVEPLSDEIRQSSKVEKHIRFNQSTRRRIHTENEVSTAVFLEQLSSLLNDESAHLENADSSVTDEEEQNFGNFEISSREPTFESIKQPLSNIDRYSMLGGQII